MTELTKETADLTYVNKEEAKDDRHELREGFTKAIFPMGEAINDILLAINSIKEHIKTIEKDTKENSKNLKKSIEDNAKNLEKHEARLSGITWKFYTFISVVASIVIGIGMFLHSNAKEYTDLKIDAMQQAIIRKENY